MDHRFFGRVGRRTSMGIALVFALALTLVGVAGNASPAYANGGGGSKPEAL